MAFIPKKQLPKRQQGVVLLVSMIMLLLLTVIGISGSQVTGLEEKMAGNMRDRNIAFQAAEAALKEGESKVSTLAYNCSNGRYKPMDIDCDVATAETLPVWENPAFDWYSTDSVEYSAGDLGESPSSKPRYIIERLDDSCSNPLSVACTGAGETRLYNFRITARASGGTAAAVVMLQSVYQSGVAPP